MDEEIDARLTQVFRDVFANDSLNVLPLHSAKDIAGWDSLAHISLMLAVQRAFRIRFSAAETTQLDNVGALMALIDSKQKR